MTAQEQGKVSSGRGSSAGAVLDVVIRNGRVIDGTGNPA